MATTSRENSRKHLLLDFLDMVLHPSGEVPSVDTGEDAASDVRQMEAANIEWIEAGGDAICLPRLIPNNEKAE